MTTTRRIDTMQTAAELRKALKSAFPGVKFSVRRAAGDYSALNVTWTDGPTGEAVRGITATFISRWYDRMAGDYIDTGHTLEIDGETVTTNVEHVSCERRYSVEATEWASRVTGTPDDDMVSIRPGGTVGAAGYETFHVSELTYVLSASTALRAWLHNVDLTNVAL